MVAARASFSTKFGTYLRKTRQKKYPKLSGRKFASEVGITGAYLSNIELGKVPPPQEEIVIAIADKLGEDKHKLLRMAGHIDPDLKPILRDMSAEQLEMLSLYEKYIKDNDINVSMKQVAGLFAYAAVTAKSEVSYISNILREMANLVECIGDGGDVSPELQAKMEEGLKILGEEDEVDG